VATFLKLFILPAIASFQYSEEIGAAGDLLSLGSRGILHYYYLVYLFEAK